MSRKTSFVATALLSFTATCFIAGTATAAEEATTETSSLEASKTVILEPGETLTFQKGEIAHLTLESETAPTQSRAAIDELAPPCIVAKAEKGFVQVYNNCTGSSAIRIKVKLSFGPDTQCKSIEPGTRSNVGPAIGKIDGVFLC